MKSRFLAISVVALIAAASLGGPAFAQPANPPPASADGAPPPPQQSAAPRRPVLSPEDRAIFFDAHLAAVKTALKLTPDQEKLWPAAETAVRDAFAKRAELRQRMTGQPPASLLERMKRMAEMATTRGETMRKIVDAAGPLYTSLSEDQKRRLSMLMRGHRGAMGGMGAMGMPGGPDAPGMPGMAPPPGREGPPAARGGRDGPSMAPRFDRGPRMMDRDGGARGQRDDLGDRPAPRADRDDRGPPPRGDRSGRGPGRGPELDDRGGMRDPRGDRDGARGRRDDYRDPRDRRRNDVDERR